MIDIHSHLLPGVDDGSRTLAQSVAVLHRFAAEGIHEVVLTPHLLASAAASAPAAEHRALLTELAGAAPPTVTLRSGWEIMLDIPGADLTADALRLGDSLAVLVEFPRLALPPHSTEEIARIRASGRVPVVAHPERYAGATLGLVAAWREAGAVTQLDAAAPLARSPFRSAAMALLRDGLVDLVAADNHGDGRSMLPLREWLRARGEGELSELLCEVNPRRLLDGEQLEQPPPLRQDARMGVRLRRAVFGA